LFLRHDLIYELRILLPPPTTYWDSRNMLPHLASCISFDVHFLKQITDLFQGKLPYLCIFSYSTCTKLFNLPLKS
jgi:hypothetical protein